MVRDTGERIRTELTASGAELGRHTLKEQRAAEGPAETFQAVTRATAATVTAAYPPSSSSASVAASIRSAEDSERVCSGVRMGGL